MSVKSLIRKNTYYDSVTLMAITREIKKVEGVKEALVAMATILNKELAESLGLMGKELEDLTPNDFFIAVDVDNEKAFETVTGKVDELLSRRSVDKGDYRPPTLESAIKYMPDSNLVLISLPGEYAAAESRKALLNDRHVMLFSDNVSIEDELELKKLARDRGLLMMGPDCGTAIINNVPLAFANAVRKGPVGVVGASGTGTQEVTVVLDRLGVGVSQVIGTGGRDLKAEVGGIMMIEGIKALQEDPDTKVIVLISKPPAPEVAERVLSVLQKGGKQSVVCFMGGDLHTIEKYGAVPGLTLEDTAYKAAALAGGKPVEDMTGFTAIGAHRIVEEEMEKFKAGQKYLRALYTGGTLCDEAMRILAPVIGDIYSNIPLKPELKLDDANKSYKHTAIDLGDDEFTRGKPHPMIDPYARQERIIKEAGDRKTAVILMDFVLGYGANPDPAGEMIPYIRNARDIAKGDGRHLCIVGSVCGTKDDPQNRMEQEKKLMDEGVIVMPSNAQAVRLVSEIIRRLG
jgi:succinyl-CoA synthetase alpha subunit